MKVGYVVLYVNDAEACRRFWIEQIGMVEKRRSEAGSFMIAQVGFADQAFALLVAADAADNPITFESEAEKPTRAPARRKTAAEPAEADAEAEAVDEEAPCEFLQ